MALSSKIQVIRKNNRVVFTINDGEKEFAIDADYSINNNPVESDGGQTVTFTNKSNPTQSWSVKFGGIFNASDVSVGSDFASISTYLSNTVFKTAPGGSGASSIIAGIISDGVGYGVPFFTLELDNHFGHNFKFTGITGGYTDGSAYFDVNGVSTTRSLAFPEDLACDLSSVDKDGNFIMFSIDTTLAVSTWANAITTCNGYSTVSFPSGFITPTTLMLDKIFYPIASVFLNQKPFESVSGVSVWSSTESGTNAYVHRSNMQRTPLAKTSASTAKPLPVRITNISEL